MIQINDYALLATSAYKTSDNNLIEVGGWTVLPQFTKNSSSGFYAKANSNTDGSEVVIAFSGTTPGVKDWLNGNAAAIQFPAIQVIEAMKFYLDVKAANPDANITFTGHSLGGGLAALMAIFFDKQAVVFDEAPFGGTASNLTLLLTYEGLLLADGYMSLDFSAYIASVAILGPVSNFYLPRESNVTHIYLENEALVYVRALFNTIAGTELPPIKMGDSNLIDPVELHSMTLLTAMLVNNEFAGLVQKLPNFAVYLRNYKWYGVEDINAPKADLLTNLLNEQYGPKNNAKLSAFITDLQNLLGTDGTCLSNLGVKDALMVTAMEYYYNKIDVSADQFFTVFDGGIHFKYSDIGEVHLELNLY